MTVEIKALVVDDESLSRADLAYMLRKTPGVTDVVELANATEALALLQDDHSNFDVIFLDIEMPGLNGVQAVKIINQMQNAPKVVFVTAYDEYAVKAFDLNAVDYLVKPFSSKRLAQAIQKVGFAINAENLAARREAKARKIKAKPQTVGGNSLPEEAAGEAHFRKIPVEKGDGILLISLSDVRYIVAFDDKVFVNTYEEQFLTRFSLTELETRLASQGFVRIHRSYIANLQHILELQPFFNGTYNLIVDDKKKTILPVSRTRVKSLRSLIGV
jgi:two-component system LytT family response regulator